MMNNNLINTMVLASNKAINDHNGKKLTLAGVCVLNNGKYGAILDTKGAYSINELYVNPKDGMAHVSQWSITGSVQPGDDLTTVEGLKAWNDTITFDSNKISKIIFIKVVNA